MNQRYESLQVLRAIAAWMVVGHHYMQMYFNYTYENIVSQIFVQRGAFGIDLFFVLSGFVMYLTATRPGATGSGFYVKRVMRIVPAYWFFTTVLIGWDKLFPWVFAYTDFNALSLVKSYLLIPGQNPSGIGLLPYLTPGWTLIYEFLFYSVLALCLVITRRYAVLLCGIVIFAAPLAFPDGFAYSPILGNWLIWQFLFGFIIGYYVSTPLFITVNKKIPLWVQISILFAAALLMLSGVFGFGIPARTIAATLIVQACILIDQRANYSSRFAKFLIGCGDRSYSVYLCHVLVIGAFVHFTGWKLPWYLHLATIVAIVFAVHLTSVLSYRFVERGRFTMALKGALMRLAYRLEPPSKPIGNITAAHAD